MIQNVHYKSALFGCKSLADAFTSCLWRCCSVRFCSASGHTPELSHFRGEESLVKPCAVYPVVPNDVKVCLVCYLPEHNWALLFKLKIEWGINWWTYESFHQMWTLHWECLVAVVEEHFKSLRSCAAFTTDVPDQLQGVVYLLSDTISVLLFSCCFTCTN